MPRTTLPAAAAGLLLLLLAAAPATAAPSTRMYSATLTGTQESSWTTEESGTCTGDDFETHPYSGRGSGTASLTFRTRKATTVVAFPQGRSSRWGFDFQASPVVAKGRDRAPFVDGRRTGTHSTTCPTNETLTRTAPTAGCGDRRYQLDVKASLNVSPSAKPGQLELVGLESGKATGAAWGDACPYFVGLDPFKAHEGDDQANHLPGGGLLTVRKTVGSDRLRRGKALTITGKRTMPYDQTIDEGERTTRVRGETTVRWTLKLTPKRR